MQEIISSLNAGTFNKEVYKKYFLNQKTEEEMINEWIKPEEMDRWYKQGKELHGITPLNENDMVDKLKLEYPHLLDEKYIKFSENFGENFDTLLWNLIESNDLYEDEYYFNPESHESIEEHLAKLSKLPNLKITITKDQKGRFLIKRQYKQNYKYDLDEILEFDIQKEKENLKNSVEDLDLSKIVKNEIEYKYLLNNLIQKHLKIKESTDLEKIKENMKTLNPEEEVALNKEISDYISSETGVKSSKNTEIVNNILTSLKEGKKIQSLDGNTLKSQHDNNSFYIKLKENLNETLKAKVFKHTELKYVNKNLENHIKKKIHIYTGKTLQISTLRASIIKIMNLKALELNTVLNSLIKIIQNAQDIPIIKTSLDDNTISLLLVLVQKNKQNIDFNMTEDGKLIYIQTNLLNGLLQFMSEDLNAVEKIITFSIFNLIPDDVEFVKENESFLDKNQYYAGMWSMFKNSVIKNNLSSLLKSSKESDVLKNHEFKLEQEFSSSKTEQEVKTEIDAYSNKIKAFYHDLIRLSNFT